MTKLIIIWNQKPCNDLNTRDRVSVGQWEHAGFTTQEVNGTALIWDTIALTCLVDRSKHLRVSTKLSL